MNDATHNTAATKRQPAVFRAALERAEAGEDWPTIRAAQRAYLAIVRADAVAKFEARWHIPASKKSDTVDAIERAEEIMVAARARRAALLAALDAKPDDHGIPRADLCDAYAAEEIAEAMYDAAVARNREAFGGHARDARALQLYLDTHVQPLVEED